MNIHSVEIFVEEIRFVIEDELIVFLIFELLDVINDFH